MRMLVTLLRGEGQIFTDMVSGLLKEAGSSASQAHANRRENAGEEDSILVQTERVAVRENE